MKHKIVQVQTIHIRQIMYLFLFPKLKIWLDKI